MVAKTYEQEQRRTATTGHERIAKSRRAHQTSSPKLKLPESKTVLLIGAAAVVDEPEDCPDCAPEVPCAKHAAVDDFTAA